MDELVSAVCFSPEIVVDVTTKRARPRWNVEDYPKERLVRSAMRVKYFPISVTESQIEAFFQRHRVVANRLTLYRNPEGQFNGSGRFVASSIEEAERLEEHFKKQPAVWTGHEYQPLLIERDSSHQKSASPAAESAETEVGDIATGTLTTDHHHYLNKMKLLFPEIFKIAEVHCTSVSPQGPFVHIISIRPCAELPQVERLVKFTSAVITQKKSSLRHAEFLLGRYLHHLLRPDDVHPYPLPGSDPSATATDEAEHKAQLHLNRLAEAKRLQSIFREIGPHNMHVFAEAEGYLTLLLGSKRAHTKSEVSKFGTALNAHPELREKLEAWDQSRRGLLKNRGFHDFMRLRQEAEAAAAAGFLPKTSEAKPTEPREDVGPDLSDDEQVSPAADEETLEQQAEAALEQLEVNVPASLIEIGFLQQPNVMCVLWRTGTQLTIAFEELTPRINFNWVRHNVKYGLRNVLKHMPSPMWISTDIGMHPPKQTASSSQESTVKSEALPTEGAPTVALAEFSAPAAEPDVANEDTFGPTYLDFYILIDSAPRLTSQEHFQNRRVGALDFTNNNAFGQSTMIHIHIDLKTLVSEELVSLLGICKSLTEMGLATTNFAVPSTLFYGSDAPELPLVPSGRHRRAKGPTPRMLIKANDEMSYVRPARLMELDHWVRWKLACLVTHNYLRLIQVDQDLVECLLEYPRTTVFRILEKLEGGRKRLFDICAIVKAELLPHAKGPHMFGEHFNLKENFALVAHVTITPSEMLCEGPRVEISNRLLRAFAPLKERFVRVAFTSGLSGGLTGGSMRNSGKSAVRKRVGGTLERGFEVFALKQLLDYGSFLFLVSSPSQLRTQKAWMYCPPPSPPLGFTLPIDVPGIRRWLGEFDHIFNVAMYSARLGQGLSSTYHCFDVEPDWLVRVPDIERNGYTFSDGCASISPQIAERAAKALGLDYVPCAFQIRLAGIKGMVAVNQRLEGNVIHVRPSMEKFKAPWHLAFEVVTWSRPLPAHLNKQIIQILSALGLPDQKLIDVQTAAFNNIAASTFPASFDSDVARTERIERLAKGWGSHMKPGTLEYRAVAMLRAGFDLHKEPYLKSIVTAIGLRSLQEIHSMARIPVERGRYAIGIIDELGVLEPGTVYFKSTQPHNRTEVHVHTGLLCVSRSPCLHPGDARFVTAVDVPELAHMIDVIVFPQTGDRPIPDECSGGDLDGDQYLILWGDDFIPPNQSTPAFAHETSTQASKRGKDDNEVYPNELVEGFVNYIFDDKLSQIADAHTYHADKSEKGVFDEKCLRLAQAHNVAVDAPKTGKIVPPMEELSVPSWPDFMNVNKASVYRSKKVLGTLFQRSSDEFATLATDTPSAADHFASFDRDLVVEGHEAYMQEALVARDAYIDQLSTSMQIYRINDEASAITGETLYRFRSERREWESKKEGFEFVQGDLRTRFRQMFGLQPARKPSGEAAAPPSEAPSEAPNDDSSPTPAPPGPVTPCSTPTTEQLLRASAWYVATYDPTYKRPDGVTMWSFPWLVDEFLCVIKSDAVARRRLADLAKREREEQASSSAAPEQAGAESSHPEHSPVPAEHSPAPEEHSSASAEHPSAPTEHTSVHLLDAAPLPISPLSS